MKTPTYAGVSCHCQQDSSAGVIAVECNGFIIPNRLHKFN